MVALILRRPGGNTFDLTRENPVVAAHKLAVVAPKLAVVAPKLAVVVLVETPKAVAQVELLAVVVLVETPKVVAPKLAVALNSPEVKRVGHSNLAVSNRGESLQSTVFGSRTSGGQFRKVS